MKEKPILFSGEMVRAILEGRKTQTRRVVKWKPYYDGESVSIAGTDLGHYFTGRPEGGYVLRSKWGSCWNDRTKPALCPFGKPGDRLWVRETWYCDHVFERNYEATSKTYQGRILSKEECEKEWRGRDEDMMYYRADVPSGRFEDAGYWGEPGSHWKPSIHMPRWASRITLEIKAVRVERLQDISEEDAFKEGCTWSDDFTPKGEFKHLWMKINKSSESWKQNPWVWVIEFKRI